MPAILRIALSGAAAESVVGLAVYPLDTLKFRAQFGQRPTAHRCRLLFAGVVSGLLGQALDAGVFTATFSLLRTRLRRVFSDEKLRLPVVMAATCVAALASTVVEAPFTLAAAQTRLGIAQNARSAWRRAKGWRGLYAGAGVGLVRDLPFEMIEFAAYEALKRRYACLVRRRRLNAAELVGVGMVTGAIAGLVVAPLDLVVTRVLARPGVYRGVVGTMKKVVEEEGVAAVWKGVRWKMGKEAVGSAIFFAVYDGLREHFGVGGEEEDGEDR